MLLVPARLTISLHSRSSSDHTPQMTRGQTSAIDHGPPSTSVTLLQRLSSGADEQDWRRFVDLYSPFLYRWVSSAGLQDSDARDAVQDVLLTVMARLPSFRYDPNGTFRGWLRTIATERIAAAFPEASGGRPRDG